MKERICIFVFLIHCCEWWCVHPLKWSGLFCWGAREILGTRKRKILLQGAMEAAQNQELSEMRAEVPHSPHSPHSLYNRSLCPY